MANNKTMREILFRGKDIGSKQWFYGSYLKTDDNTNECFRKTPIRQRHQIVQFESGDWNLGGWAFYDVLPETVGQFTGLFDKNGVKIFEGDILQKWDTDYELWEERGYEGDEPFKIIKKDFATMERFPVLWMKNERFGYEGEDLESPDKWEVIGNIHDNPELLN